MDRETAPVNSPQEVLYRLGIDPRHPGPDFSNMAEIGQGGIGVVGAATDAALGRLVAVKFLRPEYRRNSEHIERIIREAKATAQLEHPNIVPVHLLGADDKYGVYFTMKKLQGDTLRTVLQGIVERNAAYVKEYPQVKLLGILLRVCQALAYAHSKGVIHRDLKPENILIGKYGEVTVIDWGLVRRMRPVRESEASADDTAPRAHEVFSSDSVRLSNGDRTELNFTPGEFINGTPRYMAPEQISGLNSELDHRCDIYALGVLLYEILTLCNPFADQPNDMAVLQAVDSGHYLPPRQTRPQGKSISLELEAICLKAMALDKRDRYATTTDLIHDIYGAIEERPITAYRASWPTRFRKLLKRNPVKTGIFTSVAASLLISSLLIVLAEHLALQRNIRHVNQLRHEGLRVFAELESLLSAQARWEQAHPDSNSGDFPASRTLQEIELKENEAAGLFSSAYLSLSAVSKISRNTPEVRQLKEELLMDRMAFCMQHRRLQELDRQLNLARSDFGADYRRASLRMRHFLGRATQFRQGECQLQLTLEPPEAELRIYPLQHVGEAQVLYPGRESPPGGLRQDADGSLRLAFGNYLLTLTLSGRPPVRYPLLLKHGEQLALRLVMPAEVPEGMVYIPEGRCLLGGSGAPDFKQREVSLPGFFIRRQEVTLEEYHAFWMSLPADARDSYCPRQCAYPDVESVLPVWDSNGKPAEWVRMDRPVSGISQAAAAAYCAWLAAESGRTVRLPTADEWEKAARGADGRNYPWGNTFSSTFALLYENHAGIREFQGAAPPRQFLVDCSVYGVYDLAGNVREWTGSRFPEAAGLHQIKGGSWAGSRRFLPLSKAASMPLLPPDVGFRYVMPLPENGWEPGVEPEREREPAEAPRFMFPE